MANFQVIDSSFQQSITSAVLSTVTTAIAIVKTKHKNKMLSLQEIIKKSLLLRESFFTTPPPDSDATPKALLGGDSLLKVLIER